MQFSATGVIPACLLPFNEDLSIDEPSFRKHLRDVAAVRGVSAITVNGHASEVSSCTFEEQERVLHITLDEIGERMPIVSGVYSDSSMDAARIAAMAERMGASALLVFPSAVFARGVQQRPEMAIEHFKRVAEGSKLPLIIFRYAMASGMGYTIETLLRLIDEVPTICAIKDSCGDPMVHEQTIRALKNHGRRIKILTTHSAWLLPSLVLGCDGLLSGAGSTIADLQVALFEAVQHGELREAQRLNDSVFATTDAFYRTPATDMHNRMKEAQVAIGRLPNATVRPPLVKLSKGEIERITSLMKEAGIERAGATAPRVLSGV